MSKYRPLQDYLLESRTGALAMTFAQIEAVLGQPLPASAFTRPGWWANDPTPDRQSEAWLKAGYRTENVDVRHGALVFRRVRKASGNAMRAGARDAGKYARLGEHLRGVSGPVARMTFGEIERVLGFALPESAFTHRAWWSNNASNNVMTRVWLDAGFRTARVDVAGRVLEFRRVEDGGAARGAFAEAAAPYAAAPGAAGSFFGCMAGTVRVARGCDLTAPADPDWGDADWGDPNGGDRR